MIDFIDIRFHGTDFGDIGKKLSTLQRGGYVTQSSTAEVVGAGRGAPFLNIKINRKNKELRIWGCPAKWLQCHNGIGSNDLHSVVASAVALVFAHLQRSVPASVQQTLDERSYGIAEVHVAELHRMPHALISAFCANIRRFAPDHLQATALEEGKGIGVRLSPRSRERQILMYDKHHYFRDGSIRHRQMLLGHLDVQSFERLGPALYFDRLMDEHLNQGIRVETRHLRNLKPRGLHIGSAWTPITARDLHLDVLADIHLSDLPPVAEAEALLSQCSQDDRRLIALWLDGRNVRDFFDAESTYYRWRKRVLRQFSIDVSSRPVPCTEVQWSSLIAPSSLIETPDWAIDSPLFYEPLTQTADSTKSPAAHAWPVPTPLRAKPSRRAAAAALSSESQA